MFSKRLKEVRKSLKLTQEEAAKKLGIARTTYSGYETGNAEPDNEILQKIADLYNVSVDFLFGRTDDPTKYNDAETTIRLIKEEAARIGLSIDDPRFQKLLSDAFEMLRLARGKNGE
jgi:transcriptional regulator with XRE-family HTH domain